MAKICIDARCLLEGRRTGVEEYTLGLLENLFDLDKKNEYVLFFNSWKKPGFDFSVFSKFENVQVKQFRIPNKILNFFFWYFAWPKIDHLVGGADLVFLPNIIFNAVSQKTKLVITIHDLSFERYPEYFSAKRRWWHIFINSRKICQRANSIVAVSASTKNDLLDLYKIAEEKISVVYSAISEKFKVIDRNNEALIKIKEKYNLPYKFILHLGTLEPRKNIISLVKAFNTLQDYAQKNNQADLQKYNLVIAGSSGWSNEEIFSEIERSPFKEKIKFISFVKDEDKEYVYNLASLFAYPSFFEGFGFPPLEAMRCGVPVICGNNSSLPEIVGSAGLLIDADKPDEIYHAMKEILLDDVLRKFLIQEGQKKSAEFGWKKTAQKTLEIFMKK